jgi:hypothetical protein
MGKNKSRSSVGSLSGFDQATADGYSGNGLSLYSRRSAKGNARTHDLATQVDSVPRLVAFIAKHERELGKYRAKLKSASDPKERERLQRHVKIKMEFLERVRGDRRAELAGTP